MDILSLLNIQPKIEILTCISSPLQFFSRYKTYPCDIARLSRIIAIYQIAHLKKERAWN